MNTLMGCLSRIPFVAILRGILPDQVEAIAGAILARGIEIIEVPLNSPDPLRSIERLAACMDGQCLIGAGTVLDAIQVDAVYNAGGMIIVSPNANPEVIGRAQALGMEVLPGVRTATEAFSAIKAGAKFLKMFPVGEATAFELGALKSVLPDEVRVLAVGGVNAMTLPALMAAGADGFGIGSALYKPGDDADTVSRKAGMVLQAWKREL